MRFTKLCHWHEVPGSHGDAGRGGSKPASQTVWIPSRVEIPLVVQRARFVNMAYRAAHLLPVALPGATVQSAKPISVARARFVVARGFDEGGSVKRLSSVDLGGSVSPASPSPSASKPVESPPEVELKSEVIMIFDARGARLQRHAGFRA